MILRKKLNSSIPNDNTGERSEIENDLEELNAQIRANDITNENYQLNKQLRSDIADLETKLEKLQECKNLIKNNKDLKEEVLRTQNLHKSISDNSNIHVSIGIANNMKKSVEDRIDNIPENTLDITMRLKSTEINCLTYPNLRVLRHRSNIGTDWTCWSNRRVAIKSLAKRSRLKQPRNINLVLN